MNGFRQRFSLAPIVIILVLLHSPIISGQRTRPTPGPTVRQQVEIAFQNGVRNAQSRNDVYGQMRALEKTLNEIKSLRAGQSGLSKVEESQFNRRTKQLQRMLARKTTIEIL